MLPIRGLFEVAVRVRDLARAESFYREVLGLEPCVRDEERKWLFLWAGGKAAMVVLQEDRGSWPPQHFAFRVEEADLGRARDALRARAIAIEGPVPHASMPGLSLYFEDPDGNALELYAPPASG